MKGARCTNQCETRGYSYYWCQVGANWDHCSRSGCPPLLPYSYNDCSAEFVDKRVWFEYLYYPGYWLSKGYSNKEAALWKASRKDLFCPDEGFGWHVHGAKDGSVYLETTRPGYEDYFLIGYGISEEKDIPEFDEDGDIVYEEQKWVYNMGNAISIKDSKQYHETFAFRIMCKNCASKDDCILWRLHDEYKLYASSSKYLKMCKHCGDEEWFKWRVHAPKNYNLTCSSAKRIYDHTHISTQGLYYILLLLFLILCKI